MTTSSGEHPQSQHHVPLAIIGLGCLFPDAQDHRGFWANIAGGIDSVGDIPETHWPHADYFDADPKAPDRTYARKGAFLSAVDFDPREFGIPPTTLEATDTAQLLGLVAAKQALMDAGYGEAGSFDRERVSVMLGVTGALELVIPLGARLGHPLWQKAMADCGVDPSTAERISDSISDGMVGWQEASFPGLLGNVVAGRIANRLDIRGTNCVVDAACASSLSALHLAGLELSAGRADMVVSGGIDTFNDIFMYMCFSKTPALSPSGHARPFDASADGTTLGEGLGIVVLKRLDDARRDGNRIYAVIKGLGSSSDGRGTAIYSPSVDGQTRCLRTAYQHAEVDPASVELVEAHGTGTKVGDAIELEALTEVFGSCRESGTWCAVGSVKSQIGHTKAAAGAAGIIKAALALHHKVLPPTIKIEAPATLLASEDSPFYANTVKRPWLPSADHPRRAAVSSFGFGGSNFHCVLEEQGNERPGIVWDRNLDLVALSARTREDLTTALDAWPEDADWTRLRTLAARSRSSFDLQHAVRLVVVMEKQRPTAALASARRMLDQQPERRWWSTPEGAWFGSGERAGKLAFLFPGQGSQKVGMLRELACAFPQALAALAEANEAFADGDTLEHGQRLSDHIYPVPSFDDDARRDQDLRLRSTDIAQPALGAAAVAACRVLEHFGVKPDAVSGHSYGELPALWAAGRIDTASLHRLSRLRGRLMAAGDGDRGSMLAVAAPLAEVERLLADKDLDLVIANRNAPEQAVISGASDLIAKAAEACEAQGLNATRLPVAAAFHSPLVAAAREPFATALSSVAMAPARLAVYANATADRYPEDASLARDLLADQLTRPVEFVGQIEKLYEDGVRCFVEVGPGARLSGLTRAILAEREHTTVAMDASSGRREGLGDLTRVIAALTALGHGIDLTRWAAGERTGSEDEAGKRPGLRVPIRGSNYRAPRPQSPPRPPTQTQIKTPQPRVRHEDPALMAPHAPAGPQDVPAQAPAASPATAPLPATTPTNTAIPATAAAGLLAPAPAALHQALMVTQQTMTALQQLHERSADLHRRFLEGQEAAHRGMAAVAEQQQQLMLAALGAPLAPVALTSAPSLTTPAPAAPPVLTATPPPAAPPVAFVPAVEPAATPVAPAIDQAEPATDIAPTVLEVVAEKTGYPTDMLEPQMALEADLGIDSIKRVEILSALQERFPGAPAVRSDQLGSLHTLADVIDLLGAMVPDTAAASDTSTGTPAANSITDIAPTVLEVVAEKTGYPTDMLEPQMALEADLGIDSIKRVEILSALQEQFPGAPAVRSDQLGSLHTLADIIDLLGAMVLDTAATPGASTGTPAANSITDIAPVVLEVVAEKTGYPTDMLEPQMALEADLGIDSIKRVEILSAIQERFPGAPAVRSDQLGSLHTLADITDVLSQLLGTTTPAASEPRQQDTPAATASGSLHRLIPVAAPLRNESSREPITLAQDGEVWISDDGTALTNHLEEALKERKLRVRRLPTDGWETLETPDSLSGLIILSPANDSDHRFIERAFSLLHDCAPAFRAAGANGSASLLTVSRLDGSFGLAGLAPEAIPESGGLAGLAKTAGLEWPEVHAKAVDLDSHHADLQAAAASIVDELLTTGPAEVGLRADGSRSIVGLEIRPLAPESGANPIAQGDLIVVSGGARGVTAKTALALAEAFGPTLLLLGRSPTPQAEPAALKDLSDPREIKPALLKLAQEKLSPRQLEERFSAFMAAREIRDTLAKIEATGARALYRSLDIRDAAAVRATLAEIQADHGPVRGLVHGAGVLADRLIEEQTPEQFRDVYETKVAGLRALLEAIDPEALKVLALFSSTTARFGRRGQVAYAAANEVLNKLAWRLDGKLDDCRVVSLGWGPWDGGMVTPSLAKLFAAEGVALITPEAGGRHLVAELTTPRADGGEVLVLGGPLPEATASDLTHTAPIDTDLSPCFERDLDVAHHPVLRDHVLDGRAVLPAALMLEWLAHGALHGQPGLSFCGFDSFRVLRGVVLASSQPVQIRVLAGTPNRQDDQVTIPVELHSLNADGSEVIHARAQVLLANALPGAESPMAPPDLQPYTDDIATMYTRHLFHGPALQGIEAVEGCSQEGIVGQVRAAPAPARWLDQPLRSTWLTDPLAIDGVFQLLILWSQNQHGAASLPCSVKRYRQYSARFPATGTRIVARIMEDSQQRAVSNVDILDGDGQLVARLEGYECVVEQSLQRAFRRNQLDEGVLT